MYTPIYYSYINKQGITKNQHMKIKTYNRGTVYDLLHTIIVALSPNTPKAKRKSLMTLYMQSIARERNQRLNRIIKNR